MTRPRQQARAIAQLMAAGAAKLYRRGRNQAYSRTQWALLRYISDPQTDMPTAREFAAGHGLGKSTLTRLVDRLCREKLIDRVGHPHDLRAKLLRLTPKGKRKLKTDPLGDLAAALAAKFSVEDLDVFAGAIDTLASRAPEWIAEGCPLCDGARARLATPDGAPREHERAFTVLRAFSLMAPCLDLEGASGELTPSEWTALRYFAMVLNRKAATLSSFANHNAVTVSSASYIVTSLLDQGLVAYEENPESKLSFRVSVTEAGRSALRRDPLLKIAAVLESKFDEIELALIGRIMRVILLFWRDSEGSPSKDSGLKVSG
jgi:DNA-binding MarR family transcriptional regulator